MQKEKMSKNWQPVLKLNALLQRMGSKSRLFGGPGGIPWVEGSPDDVVAMVEGLAGEKSKNDQLKGEVAQLRLRLKKTTDGARTAASESFKWIDDNPAWQALESWTRTLMEAHDLDYEDAFRLASQKNKHLHRASRQPSPLLAFPHLLLAIRYASDCGIDQAYLKASKVLPTAGLALKGGAIAHG
jgi:hypothetical protein